MWNNWNFYILLECKRGQLLLTQFWQFLIWLNIHLNVWHNSSTSRYLPKRNEKMSMKDLYTNVHSSFIQYSHKPETIHMPINWWIQYKYNRILSSITQLNFKIIMLWKMPYSKATHGILFYLYKSLEKIQLIHVGSLKNIVGVGLTGKGH